MLASMGQRQFREWLAFFDLEPFGPRQEERRAATLGRFLAKQAGYDLTEEDLFPSLAPVTGPEAPVEYTDPAEVAAMLQAATLRVGGKVT